MESAQYYESPIGKMLLTADTEGLTGIWFVNQKFYPLHPETTYVDENTEILERAAQWLDSYFSGKNPGSGLPLHLTGTSFQKAVWEILLTIPYGETMTYGEIAQMLAKQLGYQTMSAQAVGGAVGHNRISIVIPCHRVLGTNGRLTGYAGGIWRKEALLKLEQSQKISCNLKERNYNDKCQCGNK